MSIELDNPQTTLEYVDAAANLIEQMFLAHMMKDEKTFNEAHEKAAKFLAEATTLLDN